MANYVVKAPPGARPLPDSLEAGRFVLQVRDPEHDPAKHVGVLASRQKVFVLDPEAVDIVPMLPRRDAATWYGVTDACMKRWCREKVVHSSIMDDGRRWVACPWGADSTNWAEVVGYLLDRLGRDGLRGAMGQNSDAGNTHLHAWARGDVTPNPYHRQRLRRLFVREKWREAAGGYRKRIGRERERPVTIDPDSGKPPRQTEVPRQRNHQLYPRRW